jgi:hypothetical protein
MPASDATMQQLFDDLAAIRGRDGRDPDVAQQDLAQQDLAQQVDRLLVALQGDSLASFRGVLHLAAVWQPPATGSARAERVVMAINDQTPKSDLDFFLLEAGRAWAQAVLTTGKILRHESELSFELHGPAAGALSAWRTVCGFGEHGEGLETLPTIVVLTRGKGLDLEHRAFEPCLKGRMRVVLLTGASSRAVLEELVRDRPGRFEVVAVADPGARAAVSWAQAAGLERIVVEAGPSSAAHLYRSPPLVDRLSLSRYLAASIPASVVGGSFPGGELEDSFEQVFDTAGAGDWRFEQWKRKRGELSRKFKTLKL